MMLHVKQRQLCRGEKVLLARRTQTGKLQENSKRAAARLPFSSDLPQMMKDVDHVPYSTWGFFDLRGQIDTGHGNDLNRENKSRQRYAFSVTHTIDVNYNNKLDMKHYVS